MNFLDFFSRGGHDPPPLAGPGDFYTELCGFTRRASDCRTGVGVRGVPRTGKSSLIDGCLREFARHECPIISIDFEGNQDHRLRAAIPPGSAYRVHRIDVTTKGGIRPRLPPLFRSKTARVAFSKAMAPMHGHQNDYFDGATQRVLLAGSSQLDYWGGASPDYHMADLVRLCLSSELLSELGRKVSDDRRPVRRDRSLGQGGPRGPEHRGRAALRPGRLRRPVDARGRGGRPHGDRRQGARGDLPRVQRHA